MSVTVMKPGTSRIKELVSAWGAVRQLIRSGDKGSAVPVVIPRDRRGARWLLAVALAVYLAGLAWVWSSAALGLLAFVALAVAALWWWRRSIVEIEQGTTGIISRYGEFAGTMPPGRHYLWWPWQKVEFIVDTSTEIPYTAPVLACPTRENVPLKSIEFFLKFRIVDPVLFVRHIGASNFDMVLSSAVQDAIRQRSRQVQTERAYDLRGGDVGSTQELLSRQMSRYGVKILGANIPDVQLPEQYQEHLATRERVSKELAAYARGWELVRKQRMDALLMETERAKKLRDAKRIGVREAVNKARQDVARMLQDRETEAQRVRWEIEARGRATLASAENEAKALQHLSKSYADNRAILQYELAVRRLEVAGKLVGSAPRPLLVKSEGEQPSALSMLLLSQLLPRMMDAQRAPAPGPEGADGADGEAGARRPRPDEAALLR